MRSRPKSRYGRRQLVSKSTEKILYKKKLSLKAFFAKVVIFGSLVFLSWFFLSGNFSLRAVNISGTNDLVASKLQNTVASYQNNIIRKNVYFIIPAELESYIREKMPELAEVKAEKNYETKTLNIQASLREVSYNWYSAGVNYTVDREGVVLDMENKAETVTIRDETGRVFSIGDRAGEASLMAFINKLTQSFNLSGSKLNEIKIDNTYKKDVAVKAEEGFEVYFSAERDPVAQISNLTRVLQETKKKGQKVSYIDLRIADRIFYK